MIKDLSQKGKIWQIKTKVTNEVFENLDFTNTNFNSPIFDNVSFKNCLFEKSSLSNARLYNTNFESCDFINVDLRTATLGSHGGALNNCLFRKCDFRGKNFYYPRFISCTFDDCKLKKIDFNDSSFQSCKFIGKMEDVTFNGMYHDVKTDFKPLENVDFSEAIFGDFVAFENCDLSTCVPPKGKNFSDILYVFDMNNPSKLSTGTSDRLVIPKE